jgi:hypothetical protein
MCRHDILTAAESHGDGQSLRRRPSDATTSATVAKASSPTLYSPPKDHDRHRRIVIVQCTAHLQRRRPWMAQLAGVAVAARGRRGLPAADWRHHPPAAARRGIGLSCMMTRLTDS